MQRKEGNKAWRMIDGPSQRRLDGIEIRSLIAIAQAGKIIRQP